MIKLIRGAIAVFLFVFFGLSALIIRYSIFPFHKSKLKKYEILQKSWQFFVWILKTTKIIDLNVNNLEKIKNIKNSIIVSTHPSFIDVVILMSIIPYSTCFVAEKLSKNIFFKGMVELLFILEGESIEKWLVDSCKKMEEGMNIIIFPMGRRHYKNESPRIRRGASLIAQKTGKDIVALHLDTSFDFLQINQPIYDAGSSPVEYTLNYIEKINIPEYLEKYKDEVTFKTEVTKKIAEILYGYKN